MSQIIRVMARADHPLRMFDGLGGIPQRDASVESLTRRRILAHSLLALALLATATLVVYPPARTSLYPACPIHQYLHLLCPGCGATRALAALLHGHLQEALRLNALFVLLLPFALAGLAESYRRALLPSPFCWPQPPAAALYATLAATTLFTVARNLP